MSLATDVAHSGPLVPTTRVQNVSNTSTTIYHELDTVKTIGVGEKNTSCNFGSTQYDATMATVCAMYFIFGLVYCFFGYRCFKATMFLTGFMFGSAVVFVICLQEKLLPSYGNAGVAVSAGILFGLITMLVQYVGLFMTGFHTGLFLAVVGVIIAEEANQVSSVWIITGILLATGLLFAILNLYFQKGLTIIGTSIYGGALVAIALDYFVERFKMCYWIWQRIAQQPLDQPCWFSWLLLLGVWPFLLILGVIIQCAVTGQGIYHDDMHSSKKLPAPRVRTREQNAELRQKKYRYLYQVRTAHGDVISQNYVQALQRRTLTPNQSGDMNTFQSDSTHLSQLPGEHAQLAALTTTESEDDLVDSRETSADILASSQTSVNYNLNRNCR